MGEPVASLYDISSTPMPQTVTASRSTESTPNGIVVVLMILMPILYEDHCLGFRRHARLSRRQVQFPTTCHFSMSLSHGRTRSALLERALRRDEQNTVSILSRRPASMTGAISDRWSLSLTNSQIGEAFEWARSETAAATFWTSHSPS